MASLYDYLESLEERNSASSIIQNVRSRNVRSRVALRARNLINVQIPNCLRVTYSSDPSLRFLHD